MKGTRLQPQARREGAALVRLDPVKPLPPKADPAYKLRRRRCFPAFALRTTTGTSVGNAALRGKPTLINFFYSDCAPCIAELPTLNAWARQHPETRVLAATSTARPSRRRVRGETQFDWPISSRRRTRS
jgi:thiol-disulfide isomerase/thioredoxin